MIGIKNSSFSYFLCAFLTAALPTISTAPAAAQETGASTKESPTSSADPATAQSAAVFEQVAQRAAVAREANQMDQAVALYQEAVQLRPSWGEGWWYLGTLFYEVDRYVEARDAFQRLVAIQPEGGAGWALLGLCEYRMRKYAQALDHIQRGRSLGLGDSQELKRVTRYHAALLLTRFEQFEEALLILFALAREKGEGPELIEPMGLSALALPLLPSEIPLEKRELVLKAGRANYWMATRRLAEARVQYEELIAQYPDTPNVHYIFGVFQMLADKDAALEEFRRELQVQPGHVSARLRIAFEYIKRGESTAALPYAAKAVELAPQSFTARKALGRAFLETGEIARAIEELEAGVRLAPDSAQTRYLLVRAYVRAGRKADAARERAEFQRLDRIRHSLNEDPQSVGASDPELEAGPPD